MALKDWKKLWDRNGEIIFFNKKITSIHLKIEKTKSGYDITRWIGNASFPLVGTRIENLGYGLGNRKEALTYAKQYMRTH